MRFEPYRRMFEFGQVIHEIVRGGAWHDPSYVYAHLRAGRLLYRHTDITKIVSFRACAGVR